MSIFNLPSNAIRINFTYKFTGRFKDFAKKSGQFINEMVIHDMIVSALGPAWKQAVNSAPRDTGFLQDHIFVYMSSNTEGYLASEADYSAAQEQGYRNKRGNWVNGRHFMRPAAMQAKQQLFANMKILEKAFIAGTKAQFKAAGVTPKSGYPSVAKKPSRTGFTRQTTARKRPRSYYFSGVSTVSFKKVQRFGLFRRGAGRQLIGGRT